MKWATRIVIALVAGAILQTLVAWGCAAWGQFKSTARGGIPFDRGPSGEWQLARGFFNTPDTAELAVILTPADIEICARDAKFAHARLSRISSPFAQDVKVAMCNGAWGSWGTNLSVVAFAWEEGTHEPRWMETLCTGYPWLSMEATAEIPDPIAQFLGKRSNVPVAGSWYAAVRIPNWLQPGASYPGLSHGRRLPLMPIWPGFVANSALYGAVVFSMLFARGLVVRRSRRRRGVCVACGYDVRGLAKCPECGGLIAPAGDVGVKTESSAAPAGTSE